jgi:hypothetical protein
MADVEPSSRPAFAGVGLPVRPQSFPNLHSSTSGADQKDGSDQKDRADDKGALSNTLLTTFTIVLGTLMTVVVCYAAAASARRKGATCTEGAHRSREPSGVQPERKTLASTSADNPIRRREPPPRKEKPVLRGFPGGLHDGPILFCDPTLASTSDGPLWLWDPTTGKKKPVLRKYTGWVQGR